MYGVPTNQPGSGRLWARDSPSWTSFQLPSFHDVHELFVIQISLVGLKLGFPIPSVPSWRIHHAIFQHPGVQTPGGTRDRQPARSPFRQYAPLQNEPLCMQPPGLGVDVARQYVDRKDVPREGVWVAKEEG